MVEIQTFLKILASGKLRNSECPNCKNKENLEFRIYGGLVRILMIPIAPTRRITKVFCTNCQKEFKLKEVNDIVKQSVKYEKTKISIKTPIWQFSGIIILLSILSFAIYTGIEMTKLEKNYIRKPERNDVYKVNIDGKHTTLKVSNVTKDSVTVLLNKYTLDNYKGIDKINLNENYTSEKTFSKKELLELFNENSIYEIQRNQ
ncbi:hypothetical protein [Flavobacterium aquatile]|uniref:Zinc-ribbon 15 domain-containing protein n=1 Tax=Flavobacterium aquatile LMG 4008 = ATCC 11947 TaxID=1453498 RepID=A0A095UYJ5_9FLAO|nr:hypothetical protein [Flavobacterium aquatile]KGD67615.1 hypothetical protein LG45_10855 [Flavobacterium aquatile LMG 4008 = ATCC 11947]OXA67484.1 hypothetical protein B0A61_06595 [Flavobacterium aquatile LMG 4008 = ATCC 11947]GEC79183.1 hypothetical protein FAQ01_20530 [Flavobacterium aquatile]